MLHDVEYSTVAKLITIYLRTHNELVWDHTVLYQFQMALEEDVSIFLIFWSNCTTVRILNHGSVQLYQNIKKLETYFSRGI